MFAKFLEGIEATIDHVINELAKDGAHLVRMLPTLFIAELLNDQDVIGFCGGGSLLVYPIQRLCLRYQDKITILDCNDFNFRP